MKLSLRKFVILLALMIISTSVDAKDADIVVHTREVLKADHLILGSSIYGWWGDNGRKLKSNPFVSGDYGHGVWDPERKKIVDEPLNIWGQINFGSIRFIGMAHNWQEGVFLDGSQTKYSFGIDEQMKVCKAFHALPVIAFQNIFEGVGEAVGLIDYLNGEPGSALLSDLNGARTTRKKLIEQYVKTSQGLNWANLRAINGYPEPYGVKYFEIGNETWSFFSAGQYSRVYLDFYQAIKKEYPSAKIGVVLGNADWNEDVLKRIGDYVDFGIFHVYPTPVWGKLLETMSAHEIFTISLALPITESKILFTRTQQLFKKYSGKSVPIAVTEFNGGYVQDKPVPYRHSLGCALVNAELLKFFMQPESNVSLANYWNFSNEYWGMIANGFNGTYKTLNNPYYKRPNYYVFEMYHQHFGDVLIGADVRCDGYDISDYQSFYKILKESIKHGRIIKQNLLPNKWYIRNQEGVDAMEQGEGSLKIDFINPAVFNYYHSTKTAIVEPDTYYKLSGYVKTDNLIDNKGVCLEVQDGRGWPKTHSASFTEKITGANDWTYVETVYKTLPDAKTVNVIARRIGDKGPLKGKTYFKNIKLEKFIPSIDSKIPYLSVNAAINETENKVYLMVINKNLASKMTSTINMKDFVPDSVGNAWILNAPAIESTNEKSPHNTVKVIHKEFKIWSQKEGTKNSFEYTFEPHSLTAIEIIGKPTESIADN